MRSRRSSTSSSIDGEAPEGTISIEELEAMGEPDFDFEATWRAVEPDDVLCLIYTSGTTGPPKGVQLTHANMVAVWRACDAVQETKPGGRMISFLPSAHIADRWAGLYAQMLYGSCVLLLPGPAPDGRLLDRGQADRLGRRAAHLGKAEGGDRDRHRGRAGRRQNARRPRRRSRSAGAASPPTWTAACPTSCRPSGSEADEQVLSGIRAMLGLDEVESFVVGAAPTPPEVLEFFLALGIEIRETWGMSETTRDHDPQPAGRHPGRGPSGRRSRTPR